MKKSLFLLVTILLLPFFLQTAHGAIVYSSDTTENYAVDNNGGTFFVYPFPIAPNNVFGGPSSDIRTENFMGNGASMTLSTAATGTEGNTPGNLQISAYTTIDYHGIDGRLNYFAANTVGANVKQGVIATFQKEFINDEGTTLISRLDASLAGTEFINFDSFVSGYSLAEYNFTASIDIVELNSTTSGAEVSGFELTESNTSDSIYFSIKPEAEGYSYLLTTSLRINTAVKNWTIAGGNFQSSELSGIFNVGNAGNPLVLNASVGSPLPTPVPPSLFLLISGVAGISFIRHRRDQ